MTEGFNALNIAIAAVEAIRAAFPAAVEEAVTLREDEITDKIEARFEKRLADFEEQVEDLEDDIQRTTKALLRLRQQYADAATTDPGDPFWDLVAQLDQVLDGRDE